MRSDGCEASEVSDVGSRGGEGLMIPCCVNERAVGIVFQKARMADQTLGEDREVQRCVIPDEAGRGQV